MYFSRIRLNPLVSQEVLAKALVQDTYREHQALWQLFDNDPESKRDFLYRQVIENGQAKYYVLSARVPEDQSGQWVIDPPKVYKPKVLEGQRLFFSLRANPVVTVTSNGKKRRHDVVMHEKKRLDFKALSEEERPPLQNLIQTSCSKWLDARAEANGFNLDSDTTIVEAYHQHRSRSKAKNSGVAYSSVDFQGVLTVTDAERFHNTLMNGIGKAKAFGCGLMLIRPLSSG